VLRQDPLTVEEAERCFAPFKNAARILLAVSGGPDSVALMNFAAAVGRGAALAPVAVASVDHRLQPGSDLIARDVVDRAKDLGFEAHVLAWEEPKPQTGIQAAARQARYRLLEELAQRLGASHIATAHTLDDQAETILFRMARGSGLSGLAGMRAAVQRDSLLHVRPFLDVPKRRLVEACVANGWPFVDDKANSDPRFARSRMRKIMPLLAPEGLDAPALAKLGRRAASASAAIEQKACLALDDARLPSSAGRQVFTSSRLLEEPTEILIRALEMSLTGFAKEGPPRLGRLERLVAELQRANRRGLSFRRTLHGAVISWREGSPLQIAREPPRSPLRSGAQH
jgi:tRNA(Ile)-lysidine synthase